MFSMTGFGKGEYKADGIEISVEVKTVNNRYLDVAIKSPKIFNAYEEIIRSAVRGHPPGPSSHSASAGPACSGPKCLPSCHASCSISLPRAVARVRARLRRVICPLPVSRSRNIKSEAKRS